MFDKAYSAKYGLAIVDKIVELLGHEGLIGLGYDIGCAFSGTVGRSSLGARVKDIVRFVVGAFHGYAHNAACQSLHHPNITEGIGIEDLEGMERIFSASNHVASITRYASAFHRRQMIDLFFQQWDAEKYTNLATMLYNNYKQALALIKENAPRVADFQEKTGFDSTTIEGWLADERGYLESLDTEPLQETLEMGYVQALQGLEAAQ